ncbi:hypothetical protein EXIGLDRAFT_733080, partial [Exidia glandulosa HHB12029]
VPDLWSTYKGFSKLDGSCAAAEEMLARSGDAPVSLEMTIWNSGDALASLIRAHMHHLRSITIFANPSSHDAVKLHNPLLHVLRDPAPVLERLEIRLARSPGTSTDTTPKVFPPLLADAAPMLRVVSIHGVGLPGHPYQAFMGLRSLALAQLQTIDVGLLLHYYPTLEELAIHSREYISHHQIKSHNLRLLQTNAPAAGTAVQTLRDQLVGPNTAPLTIYVHPQRENVVNWLVGGIHPRPPITALALYSNFPDMQRAIELRYSHQRHDETWVLNLMRDHTIRDLLQDVHLLAGLRTLTIHEHMWPEASALPQMRQLVCLTIFLANITGVQRGATESVSASIFCRTSDPEARTQVPNLQTLCLATKHRIFDHPGTPRDSESVSVPASLTLLVSAHDIANLLRECISLGGKLPKLVLREVSLYDATLGGEMEELTALVDEIEWREAAVRIPDIHVREPWVNWVYYLKG